MDVRKVSLIIKNMELLLESLKLEIKEKEEEKNVIKLGDLAGGSFSDYEPDYYEEP